MTTLIVDTTPVKGHVTVRQNSRTGALVNEGRAPLTASMAGQWVAYIHFGTVEGYAAPADDAVPVFSDRAYTYTYEAITPNGVEPPPDGGPAVGFPYTRVVLPLMVGVGLLLVPEAQSRR